MQALRERLQAERGHVEAAYGEAREVERFRLEATVAAAAPPQPSAAYPPPALEPQEPWPPPAGVAGPSQPPPAYPRAHFSPGPGAERAPSAAVPHSGGAAAAGDLPPPPARAAGCAATPEPPARFLLGGPRDPLYDVWTATGQPPRIPLAPSGSVGPEVARGRAAPVRAPVRACPGRQAEPGWCHKDPRTCTAGARDGADGGLGTAAARLASARPGPEPGCEAQTRPGSPGPGARRG